MKTSKAKPKNKGGRPKIAIDMVKVEKLASIGCTQQEIASELGVTVETMAARKGFSAIYKRGMDKGRMSLRHKQFNLAMAGDRTMLVWLGKQLLGQTDKREIKSEVSMHFKSTTELIEAAVSGFEK